MLSMASRYKPGTPKKILKKSSCPWFEGLTGCREKRRTAGRFSGGASRDGKIHPGGVSSRAFAKAFLYAGSSGGAGWLSLSSGLYFDPFSDFSGWPNAAHEAAEGQPETYDVVHFQEKLEALRHSDPLWPVYDRRFHDVIEDQLPVTAPIVLIEGNWLFVSGGTMA